MRDEGHHEDMTILDNGVQLVLPPIGHISQRNRERKDLKGKAKGGRYLQQSVNNIGEGSSGWFDSPPVSWTKEHIETRKFGHFLVCLYLMYL